MLAVSLGDGSVELQEAVHPNADLTTSARKHIRGHFPTYAKTREKRCFKKHTHTHTLVSV